MKKQLLTLAASLAAAGFAPAALSATTLEELAAKLEALASENAELRQRVNELEKSDTRITETLSTVKVASQVTPQATTQPQTADDHFIRNNHRFAYEILDPNKRINRKNLYILEQKKKGELADDSVYLSGAITAIANNQRANQVSNFGYLMRHPAKNNQRTKNVSEAVIHSAQIGVTATLGDWVSGHMELLYDPQQSFGSGTLTDLNRNQVQLRQGYVTFGNLNESPLYTSLGKMTVPFGLTDTVNPFTSSTVWHAFGGLAYGLQAGYHTDNLSVSVMAIQGGAQFRAANVPVDGTSVPSKLNNYALDANYTFGMDESELLVGASYIKGSPYCQNFPVVHFNPCDEENGAYDIYTKYDSERWTLIAEFAKTEDTWKGTFNPTIPQFAASKVTSWDLGAQYHTQWNDYAADISFDVSRFESGPSGSPWERQDQIVLGGALFLTPSTKLFTELIRVNGYAPLNFISGGNLGPGVTHSNNDSTTDIIMFGTNIAF